MQRRKLIIGTYDTALRGPWTLAGWSFPEPDPQENLVEIPGRHGPLDLSTALTEGEPIYGSRELTATLECSEGTRNDRIKLIDEMVNMLNGRRWQITLPDDPTLYVEGRVTVKKEYNDLAHCAVTVAAVCDPWRLKKTERRFTLQPRGLGFIGQTVLPNAGGRVLVPTVSVVGVGFTPAILTVDGQTWTLEEEGVYALPDLRLPPGNTALTYSGAGTITISYREAVL